MTAKHCRTNRRSRLLKFVVHILFYEDLRLDTFRRESEDKLRQSMLIGSHRCLQQSFIASSRSTMPWARYSQLLPVNVCLWWSNLCSDVIWSALGLEFKLFNSSYFGDFRRMVLNFCSWNHSCFLLFGNLSHLVTLVYLSDLSCHHLFLWQARAAKRRILFPHVFPEFGIHRCNPWRDPQCQQRII